MDADDFAAAASGLHGRLARVVLAMCGDRSLAEEAAQRALDKVGARSTTTTADDHVGLDNDVHRAVLALPDRQREVVVLHYLLDLDVASIARITGTSKGAVKNALFHGRAALAERLHPAPRPGEEIP